ncbi:MAG: hypothetical protein AB8B70_08175 [Prochlorococcus sp.]
MGTILPVSAACQKQVDGLWRQALLFWADELLSEIHAASRKLFILSPGFVLR